VTELGIGEWAFVIVLAVLAGVYIYFDWQATKAICNAMDHDRDIF